MADSLYVANDYISDNYYLKNIAVLWGSSIIYIPRSAMTLIQSTPTVIYDLNLDEFRLQLKSLEDNDAGMPYTKTHNHNTTITVGGVTLARVIEIVEPYTITFEDDKYAVNLNGANSNVGDRVNVNQVSVRSANSAGLQDLSTLLAAAYQGQVVVDVLTGQSGTSTPIGTFSTPSNNITDSITIAESQGLRALHLNRSITINEDLSTGYSLIGGNPFFVLTADDDSNLQGCSLTNLSITGQFNGLNVITSCNIKEVTNVNGFIEKCAFNSTVVITGNTTIMECYNNVDGQGYPVFTVNSGRLDIMDFHGSLGVAGITSGHHDIGLDMGKLVIANTCTGGEIHVLGEPYSVEDNSGVGCTVIYNTEGHKTSELHEASYNRRVHNSSDDTITIYEADNVTPKKVFDTNSDLSDITPQ